jgi:hypothetical protein
VVDRDKVEAAVLAVDVRDELGHLALEPRRIGRERRGRRDLDEDDVADPFGVVLEQLFERAELATADRQPSDSRDEDGPQRPPFGRHP